MILLQDTPSPSSDSEQNPTQVSIQFRLMAVLITLFALFTYQEHYLAIASFFLLPVIVALSECDERYITFGSVFLIPAVHYGLLDANNIGGLLTVFALCLISIYATNQLYDLPQIESRGGIGAGQNAAFDARQQRADG